MVESSASAVGATQCSGSCSIPHVLFVKFNTVPVQQLAVLFLKSVGAMVLFLPLRVLQHSFQLALAHRKDSIPALPEKAAVASFKGLDPFRGWFLYLLD